MTDYSIKGEPIRELLRRRVVNITFTKKDGTSRVLRGTLNQKLIPESAAPKGTQTRPDPEGVVRVFDLDIEQWRSFNVDSVSELEMLDVID